MIMAFQLTILPIIVQPKEDELFSSWLFRLATANVSKAYTFTRFHLPAYSIWNRDIDRLAADTMIERLSLLTEIPFRKIFELTLRSYEQKIFQEANQATKQKWILALGVYHRSWKHNGLQFCPGCLSKDEQPYFRKSWRLALSVVCTKCQLLLHDCCPNCNSPATFFRTDIGFKFSIAPVNIAVCPKCNFDLRNSPRYPPMIGTIGFQSKLNRIISTNSWQGHRAVDYFDTLYQVIKMIKSDRKFYRKFRALIFECEKMRIQAIPTVRDLETTSTFDREHLIRIGCWLLENWPARFVSLCKETKLSSYAVVKDGARLPTWFLEEVKHNIHQPSASELSILRARSRNS